MKKIFSLLLTLVLTLSLVITLSACGKKGIPGTKTKGVLVVGMECDYAPFNWTDNAKTDTNVAISNMPGGYADGYDVQMAKKIAEALELELQIKALDWNALIPSLKNGEIDMIIAGMSPTEERKESISFTDGYYKSTHVMIIKNGSTYSSATKLSDFAGAKVAGQSGTLYADLVPQAVAAGATAGTNLDTVPLLINQIKNGVIDATIVEKPVAQGLCAADDSLDYVEFAAGQGFTVSEEDVMVSIGVRKECNFIDKANEALANITEEERTQMMLEAVLKNSGE
ncbi:MAG: transporter substrate-binding domain-containing protein [Acholeplasmatales bacterium]|nr:transporter substrate-binding domain-containing protein [Acholeplasmatales bacterium]